MKLSEKAWEKSQDIYQAITQHPFNQELIRGTLPQRKFGQYIEQDSIYLKSLARVLAKIAALSQNTKYIKQFSKFALDTIIIGEEIVNEFTQNELKLEMTGNITNATSNYIEYLLDISTTQPIEIIVAAVLPAFWIYHKVGLYIAENAIDNNPFHLWIETYSGREFSQNVEYVLEIFDKLAEQATESTRSQMLDTFYKATSLEKEFLDDIYI
ncbi:TenA family protein [Wolbachia endosymbiont of Folsomia candida]|uniref:TenA family protein n=1 Tax=Wolbachia endosymbiont of Folsomia candida TaxID=169402 RepID=UPI000AFCEF53|nr:TenA family protein [Wolbachia endosymbiont of Folsomia candida]APR99132.1 TenA family transcriptional regulator [Wolbachia endosymbiont of Folsomia candida]